MNENAKGKTSNIKMNREIDSLTSLDALRDKFRNVRKWMLKTHPDSEKREELSNVLIDISKSINNLKKPPEDESDGSINNSD